MFAEYHVIQFTCTLMANIIERSTQTAACTVSFGTDKYQSTNSL